MMLEAFRAVADLVPDPLLLVDRGGAIAATNKPFDALVGASLVGSKLATVCTRGGGTHVEEFLTTCWRATGRSPARLTLLGAGDDTLSVRCVGYLPEAGSEHVVVRLITPGERDAFALLNDKIRALDEEVKRRVEAEARIAAAERDLPLDVRALFDVMPELGWVAHADGDVYYFNRRWHEYTGRSSEEMEGWGWQSVHHPEHLPLVLERWKASIARGEPFEMSFPLRRHDGVYRWFATRAMPLRDPDGRVVRWVGINTDVDSEMRAQRARLSAQDAERRRLHTLLRQVPAIINFLRGPDLVFEFVHPKTVEALGGRDVLGKPLVVAIPECRDRPVYERVLRVYETGEPFRQHEGPGWLALEGDPAERFYTSVYLPVRDDGGAVEGVMTFDLDVTETVLARRDLENANRAKDEFLATISHELRTPLNAIFGWTVNLRRSSPPPDIDRGLAVIERNARAQTRLIEDLLDMSRLISGQLRLELVPVDVEDVVTGAIDSLHAAAEAKAIALAVEVEPSLMLHADADRLQQVVWNLVSNAVKFTPRQGRIFVGATREGAHVRIVVQDSGQGIGRELLSAIFEPFRQADASTTRRHGGLGLGLAIVRQLVHAHGGTVRAESEGEGLGSTFVVELPVRSPPAVQGTYMDRVRRPGEEDAAVGVGPVARLDGVRVLVVDDEEDARSLLTETLGRRGAEVRACESAGAAIDAFGAFRPDVIVSDIGMPEVDGYHLLRRIRALTRAEGGRTPAIALTAYARAEDAERAFAAGFQSHITKPVDPGRLVTLVANLAGVVVDGGEVGRAP